MPTNTIDGVMRLTHFANSDHPKNDLRKAVEIENRSLKYRDR